MYDTTINQIYKLYCLETNVINMIHQELNNKKIQNIKITMKYEYLSFTKNIPSMFNFAYLYETF